ncbi:MULTISPECIES: hypothetical protein [unclassified Paraburkholderia]|uniref:hypothetical protein n=1 Tax=unclassified Paraburkholderia TaxID=2615204 RepID=UPI002AB76648|nr:MULTISPECIES: hypothetical protein [unclassified Paraburkholderia]
MSTNTIAPNACHAAIFVGRSFTQVASVMGDQGAFGCPSFLHIPCRVSALHQREAQM